MKSHRLARAASAIRVATISPARTPGVEIALASSRIAPTNRIVRQASPNSNLRLNSMLFHAAVKRAAAQTQLGSRERHIEMMHSERPLDHLLLMLVEVEPVPGDGHRRCG